MDITEVALATVTDDFIAHIRRAGGAWDLDQASEFLVVAATLLDLKAARLLPSGQVEDAEDLALLEARDLLFARLLQYRAYKLVAGELATRFATSGRRVPRAVALDPHLAGLLPDLVFSLTPQQLAEIAARAMAPRPGPPEVGPRPPARLGGQRRGAGRGPGHADAALGRGRPSATWWPTPSRPWWSWPGSSPCSSCSASRRSPSSRPARWASSPCGGPGPRAGPCRSATSSTRRTDGPDGTDGDGRRHGRDGRRRAGVTSETDDVQEPAVEEGLDLELLPGGARAALEGVLMVVDEPVSEVQLAAALVLPRERVRELLVALRPSTSSRSAVSSCARSRAAGGCTAVPSSRRSSSGSSSTGRRPASPRPRSRRSPSSPTASRSAGRGSRRCVV